MRAAAATLQGSGEGSPGGQRPLASGGRPCHALQRQQLRQRGAGNRAPCASCGVVWTARRSAHPPARLTAPPARLPLPLSLPTLTPMPVRPPAPHPPSTLVTHSRCSSVSLLQAARAAQWSAPHSPAAAPWACRRTRRLAAAHTSAALMLLLLLQLATGAPPSPPPRRLLCLINRCSKRGAACAMAVAQALLAESGSPSRDSEVAFDAAARMMVSLWDKWGRGKHCRRTVRENLAFVGEEGGRDNRLG